MERYTSISQCLSDWEFCPLCSKRTSIDVELYTSHSNYITHIDNKEIKVIAPEGDTVVYGIQLHQNRVSPEYKKKNRPTYIRICCKNFHWGITYDIQPDKQGLITLEINRLSFFLKDNKTQIVYNILSDYLEQETAVTLSNNVAIFQDFKQELINFTHFNKKYLVKKIRALCLLV